MRDYTHTHTHTHTTPHHTTPHQLLDALSPVNHIGVYIYISGLNTTLHYTTPHTTHNTPHTTQSTQHYQSPWELSRACIDATNAASSRLVNTTEGNGFTHRSDHDGVKGRLSVLTAVSTTREDVVYAR